MGSAIKEERYEFNMLSSSADASKSPPLDREQEDEYEQETPKM